MTRPADVRFLKSHEWARIEDGIVSVGISDYAVEQLNKEIVYVELPEVGRKIKQGDSFGVIESVKAASDMYAPVSGTVTAINDGVSANPALVADEPYGNGWIIKIQPDNPADFESLLTGDQYNQQIAEEAH